MVAFSPEALGLDPPRSPESDWFADDVPALSDDVLREHYEMMVLMRRFEEQAGKAYATGKFAGFCHLYIGQEATGLGASAAMGSDDYMISAYREHAQALARGMSPESVMAELFGKATGCSKGKGGSMHLFSKEHHFLGGDGIVGGQVPVATGVGWAIKYRGEERVCVCFLGDAAVNQGAFHEALNMASLWKLPVIYIVENNLYGMGTAIARSSASKTLAERGAAYDMPYTRVDGQHLLRVYEVVARARQRAVTDGTPTLIESMCYRFRGHSMSDPGKYRTREEVQSARDRDPIKILRGILVARGIADEAWAKEIDKKVKARMKDVMRFAEESPDPPIEWATADVLVESEGGGHA